jgi:DNA processing protein
MEPAYRRALLARTPNLLARHLAAAGPADSGADLVRQRLAGTLPPRARAWLEHHDKHLIDSDLACIAANGIQILCSTDSDHPATLAVVSGRGAGLDAAVHAGALTGARRTIAVCARGLDRIYPPQHAGLAARIKAVGCLVRPFAPGSRPRRHHCPLRDRPIWGLAGSARVLEAAIDSPCLLAARPFRQRKMPPFALPGSIRDPRARGCKQRIRQGATLVQHSREIPQELGIPYENQRIMRSRNPLPELKPGPSPLDNKYEMLLDAAGFEPVDIDVLAFRTGWSRHTVASMLLLLELQGRVAPQPGGRYCRLS